MNHLVLKGQISNIFEEKEVENKDLNEKRILMARKSDRFYVK